LALFCLSPLGCGRKGDPIPHTRVAPAACVARWAAPRTLEVRLPSRDGQGRKLLGLEKVRVYYLSMGPGRPSPDDVLRQGQVVMERSRPELPEPGGILRLDLKQIGRPPGWLVAAAVRVGDVVGAPSETVAWLDPAF
jgi:hypothetical protein